jgi:HEAT repeat protein
MRHQDTTRLTLAVGSGVLAGTAALAADKPEIDRAAVDKSFEALKTYDWGADRNTLNPIDDAVVATQGDSAARKELETRLLAVLNSGASRSAKDYVCRTLRTVGTAESVPTLAALLPEEDLSHIARYALERIPAAEAGAAMRQALPKLPDALKVGTIGSLGVRCDAAAEALLGGLLGHADPAVVRAAAYALGDIATPEAGKALGDFAKKAPDGVKPAVADACLVCAERLLDGGQKTEAIALYETLSGEDQSKNVRLAAKRGLLAAAGKND